MPYYSIPVLLQAKIINPSVTKWWRDPENQFLKYFVKPIAPWAIPIFVIRVCRSTERFDEHYLLMYTSEQVLALCISFLSPKNTVINAIFMTAI